VPGKPVVQQVKIVRDKERMDLNGKARSKRYGFVEFVQHEHALAALRYLNNNPNIFGAASRPIVEFALEDQR
jgi:nucleolar protein 4